MEKIDAYDPEEGPIQVWLGQFELRCALLDIKDEKKAQWCRAVIGTRYLEALAGLPVDATYAEVKNALLASYGATNELREAQDSLHQLVQGSLSLKQLAVRAQYLANVALRGADEEARH